MDKPSTPITNDSCVKGTQRFEGNPHATPDWKRNGKSWSCSYCGSMSLEELEECITATPSIDFELNDRRDKIYVHKWPHAGDCPVYCTCGESQDRHEGEHNFNAAWADSWPKGRITHPFVPDPNAKSGCGCDIKSGGGPVKFMVSHMWDIEDETERHILWNRLMVECNRSWVEFMEKVNAR